MLKRLRTAWRLSKKDPKALDALGLLTKQEVAIIPDLGDGKAEFLGEGTQKEFEDFKKEQDGTAPWYKRILGQ